LARGDIESKLAAVPIFSGCSRRELGIIGRSVKEITHRAGAVIAREGQRGIGLFLILDGECSVSIGGKERARLGPGQFFGEISLLDGGPRTASVTAATDVRLLGLTEWTFRGLLAEYPSIALRTLESIAGRLRSVAMEGV
jgi:CRP/FNR family transcriptional regulator, cyclic AMP receptor protein